jgi:hypothetical protein
MREHDGQSGIAGTDLTHRQRHTVIGSDDTTTIGVQQREILTGVRILANPTSDRSRQADPGDRPDCRDAGHPGQPTNIFAVVTSH